MRLRRLAIACAAAGLAWAAIPARAGGLQVAPTSLTLSAAQNADGLWLANTGGETLHAQVRVLHWTQQDGQEQLSPSRGLVISPPMIELAAGARQLVRVIRAAAADRGREDAYRVLIDELPLAPAQPAAAEAQRGLRFVLRYSIPVFLAPAGEPPAPALQGRVFEDGGQRVLEIANRGGTRAQLGNLVRVDAHGGRTELVAGLVGYVLAGSRMRWPLAANAALATGDRLLSRINGATDEQTVAVVGASP